MFELLPALFNNYAIALTTCPISVPQLPGSFCTVGNQLFPLVILAILIDAAIAAIWYIVGALLSNNQVKSSAKGEGVQAVGTAIIAGVVLGSLLIFGSIYYNSVIYLPAGQINYFNTVLGPVPISGLCTNLGNYGYISFVRDSIDGQPFTPLGSAYTQPSVCQIIQSVYSNPYQGDGTLMMDYPLASDAVVLDNLTNQTASDINQTFVLDAYLNWLKALKVTVGLCIQIGTPEEGEPPVPIPGPCALYPLVPSFPAPFGPAYTFYLQLANQPLNGLDQISKALTTTSNLLYLALSAFAVQLIFINMFLFIWPYLIFTGLVMRGIFFLRKIGGLLIAIAIGAVLIYPTVFGIEYLSANNPNIFPANLLNQQYCGNNSYIYSASFYTLPRVSGIAQDCGCWPNLGLAGSETAAVLELNAGAIFVYGADIINNLFAAVGANNGKGTSGDYASSFGLPTDPYVFSTLLYNLGVQTCSYGQYSGSYPTGYYNGGEGMAFGIIQAFGVIGVAAYFLPIINILITIASIIGLSGLMGGDVQLAGLSRFV